MARFLAFAIVLLAFVAGVFAPVAAQVAPVPAPVPEAEAEPIDDVLRIAFYGNEAPTLDPHMARDGLSFRLISTAYETLYMWTPGDDAQVVPCLAKDWPTVSEDGLTWTIKLRDDVQFHKSVCFGEERTRNLKASDVIHSWKRLSVFREANMYWMAEGLVAGLDEYGQNASSDFNFVDKTNDSAVEGLKAVDDHTLQIKLTRPFGAFCNMLAHPAFSVMAGEAIDHYQGRLRVRAIGTAPYRLAAVSSHELYAFQRFDDYRNGPAAYKRVLFTVRNYWNQFVEGLQAKKLHEIPSWESYWARTVKDGELTGDLAGVDAEPILEPEHGYYFLSFNMQDDIWGALDADARALRKAVSMAYDRKLLLTKADWTSWNKPQEQMFPAGMEFRDVADELDYAKHNLDEAKKLLDGSIYKGGIDPATNSPLELEVLAYDTSGLRADFAQLYDGMIATLREACEDLGISVTANYVQYSDYRENVVSSDSQMFISGWFLDYADAQNFLQLFWGERAQTNTEFNNSARYASPVFDAAYEEFEALLPTPENRDKRRGLVTTMAVELAKDQPTIALVRQTNAKIRSRKVDWPSLPRQTFNDIRYAAPTTEIEPK